MGPPSFFFFFLHADVSFSIVVVFYGNITLFWLGDVLPSKSPFAAASTKDDRALHPAGHADRYDNISQHECEEVAS